MRSLKYAVVVSLLFFVNQSVVKGQQVLPLYIGSIPGQKVNSVQEELHGSAFDPEAVTHVVDPTITVYLPVKEKNMGTAVLVFPGGAYRFISYREEGTKIAKAFAERGITAFLLKYRLPDDLVMSDRSVGPLQDARKALAIVRASASEYGIDAGKIGVVGFSAGGHLAATLGTQSQVKPAFMLLVYPVISMQDSLMHQGSKTNLLGNSPAKEVVDRFSAELQVDSLTPPTYLTHAMDDRLVTYKNSVAFYKAMQFFHIPCEMRVVEKGDHGFIQRIPLADWLDPMLVWLRKRDFLPAEK